MFGSDTERTFTNKDALSNLRYGIGLAVDGPLGLWLLLHHANSAWPAGIIAAYFFLSTAAAGIVVGFLWYLAWAYERRIVHWYLAGFASLTGATAVILDKLFAFGFQGWPLPLAFTVVYFSTGYVVWRVIRSMVIRAFNLLLFAVAQLGAAWRGEQYR